MVPPDPLHVVIERLTPSSLGGRVDADDPLRMSGTVTNRSDEPWTDLGVYLVRSLEPITSVPELDAAIASDPRTDIGPRLVEAGLYVEVPDLEPGESTPFDLEVPVGRLGLSGEPGVYWVGVHVLGTNSLGRLDGADGRTRTFMPLVPARNTGTELALGVQFRNHIVRASDGRLEYLDGWQATLAEGGRLRRLLELSETAPADLPLTWVLDPAVVDAALSVAEGNPVLDVAPAADEVEDDDGDADGEGDGEGPGLATSLSNAGKRSGSGAA